jgi:hypothetical protein
VPGGFGSFDLLFLLGMQNMGFPQEAVVKRTESSRHKADDSPDSGNGKYPEYMADIRVNPHDYSGYLPLPLSGESSALCREDSVRLTFCFCSACRIFPMTYRE